MPVLASDHPKIPPVNVGKVNVCKQHRKSGKFVPECPRCNIQAHIERHTDHGRKRHVDVPVIRKTWTSNNKYSPQGK